MLYNQRGHQVLRLLEIDAISGECSVLIDETSDTFIDYAGKRFLHIMEDGDHAIWMTERSGWNHLELVDLVTGERTPLTSGVWVVRAVDDVDEAGGTIRIRALGLDADQDPYHVHHAVVDIDSGNSSDSPKATARELGSRPDGRHYVDRWSRVDLPPVHELRRTRDGSLVGVLAGRCAPLLESGWREPVRFSAKDVTGSTSGAPSSRPVISIPRRSTRSSNTSTPACTGTSSRRASTGAVHAGRRPRHGGRADRRNGHQLAFQGLSRRRVEEPR